MSLSFSFSKQLQAYESIKDQLNHNEEHPFCFDPVSNKVIKTDQPIAVMIGHKDYVDEATVNIQRDCIVFSMQLEKLESRHTLGHMGDLFLGFYVETPKPVRITIETSSDVFFTGICNHGQFVPISILILKVRNNNIYISAENDVKISYIYGLINDPAMRRYIAHTDMYLEFRKNQIAVYKYEIVSLSESRDGCIQFPPIQV